MNQASTKRAWRSVFRAGWLMVLAFAPAATAQDRPTEAPVVVVGATPAGIAASVAAARMGTPVVLVAAEDHVGGMVSNGLTVADVIKRPAVGGLFLEFTQGVLAHYVSTYGPNSPQVRACRDGYRCEPHVAERVFSQMLADEGDRIQVLLGHRLRQVLVSKNRVVAAVFEDSAQTDRPWTLRGQVFVDATYEGDLAAMAGVEYRVGRESREEYGEPHAGVRYAKLESDELLPGSTGAGDDGIQAYCFRLCLTNVPENRVDVGKPAIYTRDDYRHLLDDIREGRLQSFREAVQLHPLPNGKVDVNSKPPSPVTGAPSESSDLAEENWRYPDANAEQRAAIFQRYWNYQLGLIWFLQNDPEIPESIRLEASEWGFCRDEFVDNHHHPRQMYVRQSRRILGNYLFTEHDAKLDKSLERTRLQPAAIAIAEYPFDGHAVHKYDPRWPGVREGSFHFAHAPIQIPYGVLVPRNRHGLLVPVCCSASHVGYQALRMEPVYMALGHAAGIAAHLAISHQVSTDQVPTNELQHALVGQRGVIAYLEDVRFGDPAFPALQFLGARGFNKGYRTDPDQVLTRPEAADRFRRVTSAERLQWTVPAEHLRGDLGIRDLSVWLKQLRWQQAVELPPAEENFTLTVREFAQIVYDAVPRPAPGQPKN